MKETKYQELKKRIEEVKDIAKGAHQRLDAMERAQAVWHPKIAELEERLDTWDRRLAKWAKRAEPEGSAIIE